MGSLTYDCLSKNYKQEEEVEKEDGEKAASV